MSKRNRNKRNFNQNKSTSVFSSDEQVFSDRLLTWVGQLQKFVDRFEDDGEEVDIEAQSALQAFYDGLKEIKAFGRGINVIGMMDQGNLASQVIIGYITELETLGFLSRETSEFSARWKESDLYESSLELIEDFDLSLSSARLTILSEDHEMTALMAGVFLARGSFELFNDGPWGPDNLPECLFATQVTAATLARLASRSEYSEDLDYISPDNLLDLIEATKKTNRLLPPDVVFGRFDVIGRLVEEILMATDWLEEMDVEDIHRTATGVVPCYILGREGKDLTIDDFNEQANELFKAAYYCGQVAGGLENLAIDVAISKVLVH